MHIGAFDFSPKFLPTLATAIVLPILISLGFWQMDRATEKQQLLVLTQERLQAPATYIESNDVLSKDMDFKRLIVKGRFDDKHQYLLDNRIYKSRVGYGVYTPFSFDEGKSWIMVNRGWIAAAVDRAELPTLDANSENLELSGVLSPPPGKLLELGTPAVNKVWPARVRDIDLAHIGKDLGVKILPYVLNLDASSKQAYTQDWSAYAYTPEKNQSYAIQWFAMAIVLLLIFIGLNTRRVKHSPTKLNEE